MKEESKTSYNLLSILLLLDTSYPRIEQNTAEREGIKQRQNDGHLEYADPVLGMWFNELRESVMAL